MRRYLGIFLFLVLQLAARGQHYTIQELPALEPSIYAEVSGLDDRGHLLGTTFHPTNYRYGNFTLENGAWRAVSLTNYEYHVSTANKAGVVLGNIYELQVQPYRIRPFLWRDGTVQELHLSTNDYVVARDMNDKGAIVGEQSLNHFPFNTKAFLFRGAQVQTLDIPDATFATAAQINNRGEILINAQNHPRYWALVRSMKGKYRDIGTLAGRQTVGVAMNNRGSVAAVSTISEYGAQRAMLYRDGQFIEVGPPMATSSEVQAINDRDEVLGRWSRVGHGTNEDGHFIYRDGVALRLEELVQQAAGSEGWEILTATTMNDAGDLAGMGNYKGRRVPYLLQRSRGNAPRR